MSKNTEVKFYIQVIITDSNERGGKITIEANSVPDYIIQRDILINDKIYPDENKLHSMKRKHNEALKRVAGNFFKEAYFQMTNCEKAVEKAVKPLLEKNAIQENEILELKKEYSEFKKESDNRIKKLEEALFKR